MLKKLFSKKEHESKSGIYKIDGKNLIELDETPGNGSINSIVENFGYPTNLVHTVFTFDSKKIECLGFKTLSNELIFVLAKDKKEVLFSDVLKEINSIDWDFEYSSLNVEDILNEAVDAENLNLSFLKSVVTDLLSIGNNVYKSERLSLYFCFENEILKSFSSSNYENSATKWLKNINPLMFEQMLQEARAYHNKEQDAVEEVNKHSESLLGIPQAINNEFIELHKKHNGNVNFYNLLLAHYTQNCKLEEFLFMNKGRYSNIDENKFGVGNFVYEFGETNELLNVYKK